MKTKLRVDRFKTKDISDTPEGFEKRFEDRKRPSKKPTTPIEEPTRPDMTGLLERFGISDEHS